MEEIRQMSLVKEYMDLIDKLSGIIKSHIVINDEEITEIHVLSDTSRSPKQVARDIQSALMVRFGVNVDHKLISIAQIPSENTMKLTDRLVFEEISISKNKERFTARVTLCDGNSTFSGEATGLNDPIEVNKIICQATLNAVLNFINPCVVLSPVEIKAFDLAGEKAVAVCIAVKIQSKVEHFLGSSFIGDDAGSAVVKAALDALNRKLANT